VRPQEDPKKTEGKMLINADITIDYEKPSILINNEAKNIRK